MKDFMTYVNRWRDAYQIETATKLAFYEMIGDRLETLADTMEKINMNLDRITGAIKGQEGDLK